MPRRAAAFTLIEMVLVLALLATLAAIAVPSLARSLRGRNLDQEAERLLALTNYARDEAASQGIPMIVWIDADNGRCGVDAKPGFGSGIGAARAKEFTLVGDVHFDAIPQGMVPTFASPGTNGNTPANGSPAAGGTHGGVTVAEFEPDGTLDPASLPSARLVDRSNEALSISQTADAYGYEIVK